MEKPSRFMTNVASRDYCTFFLNYFMVRSPSSDLYCRGFYVDDDICVPHTKMLASVLINCRYTSDAFNIFCLEGGDWSLKAEDIIDKCLVPHKTEYMVKNLSGTLAHVFNFIGSFIAYMIVSSETRKERQDHFHIHRSIHASQMWWSACIFILKMAPIDTFVIATILRIVSDAIKINARLLILLYHVHVKKILCWKQPSLKVVKNAINHTSKVLALTLSLCSFVENTKVSSQFYSCCVAHFFQRESYHSEVVFNMCHAFFCIYFYFHVKRHFHRLTKKGVIIFLSHEKSPLDRFSHYEMTTIMIYLGFFVTIQTIFALFHASAALVNILYLDRREWLPSVFEYFSVFSVYEGAFQGFSLCILLPPYSKSSMDVNIYKKSSSTKD